MGHHNAIMLARCNSAFFVVKYVYMIRFLGHLISKRSRTAVS